MNDFQCPTGYICTFQSYPVWGVGEYAAFFGSLAVFVAAVVVIIYFLTRD